MLAGHRRIIYSVKPAVRSFHGAAYTLAGSSAFSRFNPWAKKPAAEETKTPTPEPATVGTTAPTFDVNFEDNETSLYWLNRELVQDTDAITSAVRSVVLEHVPGANDASWQDIALSDKDTKFKVVTESIKQVGKDMPNRELNNIQTTADLLAYFVNKEASPQKIDTSVQRFFTENAASLPPNMTFISK